MDVHYANFKIKIRKGRYENLPQLSGGELGWAVDEQRLFIGNGALTEGAPMVGNTELLTEHSDILGTSQTYSYQGQRAGYAPNTGATVLTLRDKLDQTVSVLEFGARGDGVTDDTANIQLALDQLYTIQSNNECRRILFFPAGVYKITDTLNIPAYAYLRGEGINSSIVELTANTASYIAQLTDNGLGGATYPRDIYLGDMGVRNTAGTNGLLIDNAKNIFFERVGVYGANTAPTTENSDIGVEITSSGVDTTQNVQFLSCVFDGYSNLIFDNDNSIHILVANSAFSNAFHAVTAGTATDGPKNLKILNNVFDAIYSSAIYTGPYAVGTISQNNTFLDVATNYTTITAGSVIEFGHPLSHSVRDYFKYDQTDDYPHVSNGAVLLDDKVANVAVEWSRINYPTGVVNYRLSRTDGNVVNYKSGTLTYAYSAANANVVYNDSNIGDDIGVSLLVAASPDAGNSNIQLQYTTTAGANALLQIHSVSLV